MACRRPDVSTDGLFPCLRIVSVRFRACLHFNRQVTYIISKSKSALSFDKHTHTHSHRNKKKELHSLFKVFRYFAVIKPMKIAGIDRRGRTMLMIAWCCSLIFSVPQSFIFHVEHHPNITEYVQCVAFNSFPDEFYHMIYMILAGSLMYGLPLLIILFCYASIYVELFHRSKTCMQGMVKHIISNYDILTNILNICMCFYFESERFRRSNDDVLSRAKKKTLWMTITIVIVYVVCWTPFYIMSAW